MSDVGLESSQLISTFQVIKQSFVRKFHSRENQSKIEISCHQALRVLEEGILNTDFNFPFQVLLFCNAVLARH